MQRTSWLVAFGVFHALLWSTTEFLPRELADAVIFVSLLPWLPLAWLGIATSNAYVLGFLALPWPDAIGFLWCAAVWLMLYWFIAGAVGRLTTGPA